MKLLTSIPETPITETWTWQTNTIEATDGSEQRIAILSTPRRAVQHTYMLTDEAELRWFLRTAVSSASGIEVPHFHCAARCQPVALGAGSIAFDASRTELRDGADAWLFDDRTGLGERVTIAVLSADHATLAAPVAASYGRRAAIAPMWASYTGDSATVTRGRVNAVGQANMTLQPVGFLDPFLNPFVTAQLTMFDGLPIVTPRAIGDSFSESYLTGVTRIDYGAVVTFRDLWKHAKTLLPRDFLCQRVLRPADWEWWRVFADYCQGSANPVYLPTDRPDFVIVSVAGANVELQGDDYAIDLFPFDTFKQFAFKGQDGVHYAKAVAANVNGQGNSVVTLDPPLPDGPAYAISLLLKARISDDIVSIEHQNLHSTVTVNFRTSDE